MKKLLGIVVLGLLLSGCATTESIVSSGKIKKNTVRQDVISPQSVHTLITLNVKI